MRSRFVPCFVTCVAIALTTSAHYAAAAIEPIKGLSRSQAVCITDTGALEVSKARLLDFGNYRGPFASANSDAQRFFDQGLVFGWGFNFAEAVRSFRAAARLDPACALCRWGIAWALGPSINHDMESADVPVALDAIVQARANAVPGSLERALVDALAELYSGRLDANADRLSLSYANAMRVLAKRYPGDADIAVLAAEAMMNAHAYDYWHADGRPKAWTPEIIAWLDRALQLAPAHPSAHHYRIHLFEDSRQPERAVASAEQLGALAPIVGHLVHMPSHIFLRLGRYRDAVVANRAAVQADRDYTAATGVDSGYAVHNLHFLWASALWAGDSATALHAADQLAATAAASHAGDARDAMRQHLMAVPVLTRVRLGQWDAIAAQAGLAHDASTDPYLSGLTQFASGMAYAARGDVAAASAELAALQRSARAAYGAGLTVKNIHRASAVLSVARSLLLSAIATGRGVYSDAVRHARAAVVAEDRLASDDPPVWPVPARHALGAALLHAGRAAEAKKVYRADLQQYPHNCVAVAGLAAADRKLPSSRVAFQPSAQTFAHSAHCPE